MSKTVWRKSGTWFEHHPNADNLTVTSTSKHGASLPEAAEENPSNDGALTNPTQGDPYPTRMTEWTAGNGYVQLQKYALGSRGETSTVL